MDIERTRGDTRPDIITVSNRKSKALVNLNGCSFKMTLNTLQSPPNITTQVYQLEGVITDAVNGVVEFSPTAEQANLVGLYFYDIQMVDSYNKVHTLERGSYLYTQDITK